MTLNRFDAVGNVLASGMGQNILFWKPKLPDSVRDKEQDSKPIKRRRVNLDDDDLKKKKNIKTKLEKNR